MDVGEHGLAGVMPAAAMAAVRGIELNLGVFRRNFLRGPIIVREYGPRDRVCRLGT